MPTKMGFVHSVHVTQNQVLIGQCVYAMLETFILIQVDGHVWDALVTHLQLQTDWAVSVTLDTILREAIV
jgi:hypothetical protein